MPSRQRVQDLVDHITQGRILEAIETFYAESVRMQENHQAPTVGRAANLEREKGFLGYVKTWHGAQIEILAVDGDTAVLHERMQFLAVDGTEVRMDQLAWQTWDGDRIVHERFVYDTTPAAKAA
ncbi:MAG: nuclear transport factor 2 family protein [Gemmatimonadetes bacterium]|nr:nuclear transport factor 2 family protein [Gemmatimonadota bacterium]